MVNLAIRLAEHYASLDRDLLIAGAHGQDRGFSEALVLHYIDDLDAKMGAMDIAMAAAEATGADTAYSRSLERKVVRRRWNEEEDEK